MSFSLLIALLSAPGAQAALPPLAFARSPVECQMAWASGTAYIPEIATAKAVVKLVPTYEDSIHHEQMVVENTDLEAGPRWQGGILVDEFDERNVSVGLYLRDPSTKKTIARTLLVMPASAKSFPPIQLAARVPESDEKHSGERDYVTLEFTCKSVR